MSNDLLTRTAGPVPPAARMLRLCRRLLAVSVLSAPLLSVQAYAQNLPPQAPLAWQEGKAVPTDLNGNRVDDSLETIGTKKANVILCLKGCPEPADMALFASHGTVAYTGKYLTVVSLQNVGRTGITALKRHKLVFQIMRDYPVKATLDVSVPAIRVRSSATYSPNTVEDKYPGLTGAGVNIAVIDTGVDDGVHASLPAAKFVGGFNVFTGLEGNPDDDFGHGTHVAGIALGVDPVQRGVAPGAGLVDIKALDANGSGTLTGVIVCIEKCIQRKAVWNIGVINMSLGANMPSNGLDPVAQAANRAAAAGIVTVISAGNSGPAGTTLGTPGTADDGICVAASDDHNTVDRADDTIAPFSSRGPRYTDGDGDPSDEQKPDVTAPGVQILSAQHNTANGFVAFSGTSMAAPHVAGLAALILQAAPGIQPLAVKKLLRDTAEDRGPAGWDADWGAGLVNGFAALDALANTPKTNLKFDVYCFGPSPNWWDSPNIHLANSYIQEGVLNGVSVDVRNAGPNDAHDFAVRLYVHDFGNGDPDYHICTVQVPFLASGATMTTPMCPWLPVVSGTGWAHRCIRAEIIYPFDNNATDNCAQKNVNILNTHSPAEFRAQVFNPFDDTVLVRFLTDQQGDAGFALEGVPAAGILVPPGCPLPLDFKLNPVASQRGSSKVHVRMVTTVNGVDLDLGGVTACAQIPNYRTSACLPMLTQGGQRSRLIFHVQGMANLTGKNIADDPDAIAGELRAENLDTGVKIEAASITSLHVERILPSKDLVVTGEGFGLVNGVPTRLTVKVTRTGSTLSAEIRDADTNALLAGGTADKSQGLFSITITP